MDRAITLGDIFWVMLSVGGFIAVLAIIFGIIWLTNPFRSGH